MKRRRIITGLDKSTEEEEGGARRRVTRRGGEEEGFLGWKVCLYLFPLLLCSFSKRGYSEIGLKLMDRISVLFRVIMYSLRLRIRTDRPVDAEISMEGVSRF